MIVVKKQGDGIFTVVGTTVQEERILDSLYHGWEEFFRHMYAGREAVRPHDEYLRLKSAGFFQVSQDSPSSQLLSSDA